MLRHPSVLPLAAALLLDLLWGEPPAGVHPVVWMGRALTWAERRAPRGDVTRLVYGTAVAIGLPLAWGVLARGVERVAPWPVRALVLKPTFAGQGLLAAAGRVEAALRLNHVELARQSLRWLVSRPTEDLDVGLVCAAAIESLAENFVDSWLAPLLAYAFLGLSGAYGYRAINTADAMWGYRSPRYLWLGKGAARLDDVVNWLPARCGALLLWLVAGRKADALAVWWRDAGRTASPNAGQPMAVAAGALGVCLEKRGHYALQPHAPVPGVHDLAPARRLVRRAMALAAFLALCIGVTTVPGGV